MAEDQRPTRSRIPSCQVGALEPQPVLGREADLLPGVLGGHPQGQEHRPLLEDPADHRPVADHEIDQEAHETEKREQDACDNNIEDDE